MINLSIVAAVALIGLVSVCRAATSDERVSRTGKYWIYVGTYTGQESKGIQLVEFDAETGELKHAGLAAETTNPTFLCTDPQFKYLYAANEMYGPEGGKVTAYEIDAQTGMLKQLSDIASSGKGPCHLAVDAAGRMLMVANYGSGSFASMPIDENGAVTRPGTTIQHTGGAKAFEGRQNGPHAHGIYPDPSQRYALAVDLGNDSVSAYQMNTADGTLSTTPAAVAKATPGAGPRHLTSTPDGKFVYVANELGNTVDVYRWDASKPEFTHLQTINTLPQDFAGRNLVAEIALHPSGTSLYVSNRGHDSIVVYRRDPDSGLLTLAGHQSTEGSGPRHFEIDPTGRWMVIGNQQGNNLVLLKIGADGDLSPTGKQLKIPAAVCAVFVPRQ